MSRKKIATIVETLLNEYYPTPQVPLLHQDPYTLLIAVLLSAQCTDERVNKITPILFKRASTPAEMVQLKVSEILEIIRPCGLGPRKSQAIWDLSHILLDQYKGVVPDNFEALESLPGVGHKTASVVMAQAFHQPAFPVDTHIHRCAKRWGLSEGKNVEQTERDLKKLFAKNKWIKLHLQIIFYARQFCHARGHCIDQCPLCLKISNLHNIKDNKNGTIKKS